jgi:hypothetical protein
MQAQPTDSTSEPVSSTGDAQSQPQPPERPAGSVDSPPASDPPSTQDTARAVHGEHQDTKRLQQDVRAETAADAVMALAPILSRRAPGDAEPIDPQLIAAVGSWGFQKASKCALTADREGVNLRARARARARARVRRSN